MRRRVVEDISRRMCSRSLRAHSVPSRRKTDRQAHVSLESTYRLDCTQRQCISRRLTPPGLSRCEAILELRLLLRQLRSAMDPLRRTYVDPIVPRRKILSGRTHHSALKGGVAMAESRCDGIEL